MAKIQTEDLILKLEGFYKNIPALPTNIRDFLVKIAPWIALVFGILGVIGGLSILSLSPVAAVVGPRNIPGLVISGILAIISSGLLLFAFPKLRRFEKGGWRFLFWSEVISVVSSLITLSVGNLIGTLIGAFIGFYLLFQIKSYYK